MRIYLDFDGTIVEHHFPAIGAENPNAIKVISMLQLAGHDLVLNTYRADIDLSYVHEALNFLNSHPNLYKPIETFLPKKLDPKNFNLENAKACNQLYIDDVAKGIPMRKNEALEYGMMVDWIALEKLLEKEQLI
jgi:hypothetical protein